MPQCLFFLGFCILSCCLAADYYVSSSGSGSTCTAAQPCRQIQQAVNVAGTTPGIVIHIDAGTYQPFSVNTSGTPIQPIKIIGNGAVLVSPASEVPITVYIGGAYVEITNLQFSNANELVHVENTTNIAFRQCMWLQPAGTAALSAVNVSGLLVEDSTILTHNAFGLYCNMYSDRVVFRRNICNGPGIALRAQISTNVLIESNYVNNGESGIQVIFCNDTVVVNNTISNLLYGILVDGRFPQKNVTVVNNTVHNSLTGICLLASAETTVHDNYIWNATDYGIMVEWVHNNNVVYNNRVFESPRVALAVLDTHHYVNVFGDALFVNNVFQSSSTTHPAVFVYAATITFVHNSVRCQTGQHGGCLTLEQSNVTMENNIFAAADSVFPARLNLTGAYPLPS